MLGCGIRLGPVFSVTLSLIWATAVIIRNDKVQALEDEPPKGGIVMIAFDSVEKARAWYDSPAYAAIGPLRQSAAKSRIFIVEGLSTQ
jgi:uncharacterized protein (DUF1330 family)